MTAYPILALVLVIAAIFVDITLKTRVISSKSFYVTLLILSIMTLIATQFLDGLPIVEYNYENTLNLRIGYMPIEDLSYTVAACIIVPAVWKKVHEKNSTKS